MEPVAIPSAAPADEPTVCIRVNQTWVPYILGSLTQLTQPTTWVDTGAGTVQAALDSAQDLMSLIGASAACSAANAGLFNGEDNYLSAGPSSAFDFHAGGGFSAWAWVYTAGVGALVNQDRNTTGGAGWVLELLISGTSRNLFTAVNNGTTQTTAQTGNVLFGMVAVTYDTANLRLFYNGSLVNTTAATISPAYNSSQPLRIGQRGGGSFYQGIMRDVQVYAGRVPDADIAAIYAAGGGTSAHATLKGWWKLDEGSGTTAADSSGNGNTATWHGTTPVWGNWP